MDRYVRYLFSQLKKDLKKKMILLAGPRQVGKTTFARSLLTRRSTYFNWDNPESVQLSAIGKKDYISKDQIRVCPALKFLGRFV